MTTVESVARALAGKLEKRFTPEFSWRSYREAARAAIEAMREPTIEMRKVSSFEAAERDWPAMIDAALADEKAPA